MVCDAHLRPNAWLSEPSNSHTNRSANEDDPFDSDSDSDGDNDEFMPRGKGNATLETKKGPQFTVKRVPDTPPSSTTTEKENPGAPGLGEAQKPKVRGAL